MFRFERLDIWKKSRTFAVLIYKTIDQLPKCEQFALCQQLRRATVSVSANIAEGSAKSSPKEFSHYIEIAFGSLCEVVSHLVIALDQGYIDKVRFDALYLESETLGKMLSRFRGTLEKSWLKTLAEGPPEQA